MQGDWNDIVYSLHSSKLSQLRVGGNRITGSLSGGGSEALCKMTKTSLFLLDLRHNQLAGSIPECLFTNGKSKANPQHLRPLHHAYTHKSAMRNGKPAGGVDPRMPVHQR